MSNERKWLDKQIKHEEQLLADCEASFSEVVSKLIPKIRAKALENDYLSDLNVTINFDLKDVPRVSASAFVPPVILKCQKY